MRLKKSYKMHVIDLKLWTLNMHWQTFSLTGIRILDVTITAFIDSMYPFMFEWYHVTSIKSIMIFFWPVWKKEPFFSLNIDIVRAIWKHGKSLTVLYWKSLKKWTNLTISGLIGSIFSPFLFDKGKMFCSWICPFS